MTKEYNTKVLIIGSGPAGCTAAIYTARASLDPILVRGMEPGGQLTITTDVENYPGFESVIQGPWLMEQMEKQAAHVGTKMVSDHIKSIDFSVFPFKAVGESGDIYYAKSVIIATGAQARWLGLDSEKKFMGFGVSGCATCDGFFYKGKEVIVVGGGNTASEEALYLANIASKVYLLHRRDSLRSEKILQDRIFKHPNIEVIWDSILEEVLGTDSPLSVNSVRIRNLKTDTDSTLKVDGVFVAIGHTPNTKLFSGQLDMDEEGYILTKLGSTLTSVQGVFACGDVQDKIYRQAVTAAGTGCMAALDAENFLNDN
jgi:thioredoxin reductase (NADPH)